MPELKAKISVEAEQAAKDIQNFSKKAENAANKTQSSFGQAAQSIKSTLLPAIVQLAGPAALGALALKVIQATDAFEKFENQRKIITGIQDALVEAGTAAFKLGQDFGTALKIFNDGNSSLKDQQSALKVLNKELRAYNLVLTDAASAGKVAGEVSNLLQQIRKEEALQTAVNAEAAKAYAQSLRLTILAQDKSAAGAAAFVKELGIVDVILGSILNGNQITSTAIAVTEEYVETLGQLSDQQTAFGKAADESEQRTKTLIQQLSKIKGVQALRDFEDDAKGAASGADAAAKSADRLRFSLQGVQRQSGLTADAIKEVRDFAKIQADIQTNQANIGNRRANVALTPEQIARNAEALAQVQQLANIGQFAAQQLGDAFNAAFTAISQGDSPIKAITQSIKALIVRLAAAAAAAALLSALLPGGTQTAAFGGKGFGAIFGSLFGLKLASGGIATGPTPAIIGDGGPEAVIPLSQLQRLLGGGGNGGNGSTIVTGNLRGDLIYLTNQRGGASYSRLFG